MKGNLFATLATFLMLSVLWAVASPAQAAPGDYLFTIGEPNVYSRASFVTLDGAGNRYLIGDSEIIKADATGKVLAEWGSLGTGNGEFQAPADIAVDGQGNVYVVDEYNHRIQKFDSSGRYLTQWGSLGGGNGQFNYPVAIAVASDGSVYVGEFSGARVQKFDSSGRYLTKWGSSGLEPGNFSGIRDLAVDRQGNVYVLEPYNSRVQKFTSEGILLFPFGETGAGPGQFNDPLGIAVDSQGNLFVSDSDNNRIEKFDSSGTYLSQWGNAGNGDGQFYGPFNIAVDAGGDVYVQDSGNRRLQIFSNSGAYLSQIGSLDSGQLLSPKGLAVDRDGRVYVSDNASRIQVFDASGSYLSSWGPPGQLTGTGRLAIDGLDNIYVTSYMSIKKFTSAGTFQLQFFREPVVLLFSPSGAAADDIGNLYVLDSHFGSVDQFETSGDFLREWWDADSPPGEMPFPVGLTSDRAGFVYICDTYNDRVRKYDSVGNFVTLWGGTGTDPGQFNRPSAIAADASGNIYVADTARIQVFTNTGAYLGEVGSFGSGPGQITSLVGDMASDRQGSKIYVADYYGNKVLVFEGYGRSQGFSLQYSAGAGGTLAGLTRQSVPAGGSGTPVTAVPETGYHFGRWSDGLAAATRTDSNVTGDLSVTANFLPGPAPYTLSFLAGSGGSIQGVTPELVWPGGWSQLITAIPDPGYRFVSWKGNHGFITTSVNPLQVKNVSASQTITANFVPAPLSVELQYYPGPNGNISGEWDQIVPVGGSGSTVTAVPDAGYHFVSWSDGVTRASRTETRVPGSLYVSATFAPNLRTYTLTFSAGAGGTIAGVTPEILWPGGWSDPISAIPNAGYRFLCWTGDNGFVTTLENPLRVRGAVASQNIKANFVSDQVTYTVSFSAAGGGRIVGPALQILRPGGWSDAVRAVPKDGYHFVGWTVDNPFIVGTGNGVIASSENPLRVKGATASQNFTAIFTAGP